MYYTNVCAVMNSSPHSSVVLKCVMCVHVQIGATHTYINVQCICSHEFTSTNIHSSVVLKYMYNVCACAGAIYSTNSANLDLSVWLQVGVYINVHNTMCSHEFMQCTVHVRTYVHVGAVMNLDPHIVL